MSAASATRRSKKGAGAAEQTDSAAALQQAMATLALTVATQAEMVSKTMAAVGEKVAAVTEQVALVAQDVAALGKTVSALSLRMQQTVDRVDEQDACLEQLSARIKSDGFMAALEEAKELASERAEKLDARLHHQDAMLDQLVKGGADCGSTALKQLSEATGRMAKALEIQGAKLDQQCVTVERLSARHEKQATLDDTTHSPRPLDKGGGELDKETSDRERARAPTAPKSTTSHAGRTQLSATSDNAQGQRYGPHFSQRLESRTPYFKTDDIGKFDGTSPELWWRRISVLYESQPDHEHKMALLLKLPQCLSGEAEVAYHGLTQAERKELQLSIWAWQRLVVEAFLPSRMRRREDADARKWMRNEESAFAYYNSKLSLIRSAYGELDESDLVERIKIDMPLDLVRTLTTSGAMRSPTLQALRADIKRLDEHQRHYGATIDDYPTLEESSDEDH